MSTGAYGVGCRASSGCRDLPLGSCGPFLAVKVACSPSLTQPGYRVNMPTSAELRQMRRIERWVGIIVPRVARRLVNGKPPQPGWLPRRWLTVVSGDVNPGGGIGAVWLVWRPRSAKAETHTALMERCGGQWQYTGGGSASGGDVAAERSAAGQPGQIGMIEVGGGAGCLSYAYRLQHPHSITAAPWVGSSELRVAADVGHLLFGGRRIEVPGHGRLIVAWKSRSTGSGGLRPLIVAVGRDGSELSRIGSHDSMDSYTWAKVSGQQELKLRTAGKHLRWPGPAGSNVPRRVQRVPPRTRSRPEALTIRRPP
jgi:hypothetical protein